MKTFVVYRTEAKKLKDDIETDNYLPSDQIQFEGVEFSDGRCVIRWRTQVASVAVWDRYADMCKVHIYAHPDYGTRVEWSDGKVEEL